MDVREKTASEKRLIDADAFLEKMKRTSRYFDVVFDVEEMPTVDAVEVVHAEWLYDGGSGKYFCSACDADALSFKKDDLYGGDLYEVCLTDYCPICGAKMDGGSE